MPHADIENRVSLNEALRKNKAVVFLLYERGALSTRDSYYGREDSYLRVPAWAQKPLRAR